MDEHFIDKELGKVLIVRNARSKRIIARRKDYGVELSIPLDFSLKKAFKVFEEMRSRILKLPVKSKMFFSEETSIQTYSFVVKIQKTNLRNLYVGLQNGILQISFPLHTVFEDEEIQASILKYIENALRLEAKRILPDKVKTLAEQFNFTFSKVKINKSRSRWGSCSSAKSINLSYYCLFLPEYLIDFVILHELCHTIEMNHGKNFWSLLDKVTGNRAKELTKELKMSKLPI